MINENLDMKHMIFFLTVENFYQNPRVLVCTEMHKMNILMRSNIFFYKHV